MAVQLVRRVHRVGLQCACRCQNSVDSIQGSRTHLMVAGPVRTLYIRIRSISCRSRPGILAHHGLVLGFRCCWRRLGFHETLVEDVIDIPITQASECSHLNSRRSSFSARCRHVVHIVNGGPCDHFRTSVPRQILYAYTGLTCCIYLRCPQNCSRRG